MLLKMVVEYCQLATDIPSASPEILNRLIELLKVCLSVIFYTLCEIDEDEIFRLFLLLCLLLYGICQIGTRCHLNVYMI